MLFSCFCSKMYALNGGMEMYRTHNLGELNITNVGEEVELSGWIQKIRNLGGMIFFNSPLRIAPLSLLIT